MPDWMSERRALFTSKYPAFERHWKKKKVDVKLDKVQILSENVEDNKSANDDGKSFCRTYERLTKK